MCGIIGFNWNDKKLIKKMSSSIKHRGPDNEGFFFDKDISLGHRRLSIIDLSKKGNQPMFNEDKKISVVFNGEIWNYKELKNILETNGHKFNSNSDTEVIIHGYEEYGEKIASILDGMFTFALWDSKKKKLVLARDKMGKKPLYYFWENGKLLFSSEIKAMLQYNIKREINQNCLSDYLTLRFSPDSITMFKNINKLPAGSYAILQNKEFIIKKYYSLPSFNYRNSQDIKKADNLISNSIKKRLIADVPIGVFLSGGLDSSAIVAYMSKFTKNIKTFSVGFPGKTDETKYAKIIANKFKTKHTEIHLDKDILKYLPEVIYHFDEPLADPAALPTFLLCKEVSKHVKVALSGEGGDEVFGGYSTFNYIPTLKTINKVPYPIRFLASKSALALSTLFKYPNKQILKLLSEIFIDKSISNNFKRLFYFPFNEEEKMKLMPNAKKGDSFDFYNKNKEKLDINAQEYYFNEWLPNDLLMKADKMSMASSLEVRTPFLDKDLIEYFSGLNYKSKYKRELFRKTVSNYLPSQIMKKKKQGFTLPLAEWINDPSFIKRIIPFIERLKSRNLFNNEYLNYIIARPFEFKNEHKIWVLLNFEIWCEIFLDQIDYQKIKI